MAMSPSELWTWLRNLNRKEAELVSLPVVYTVAWMGFIGPAIGNATGFDTPMVTWGVSKPVFTLSVRTFLCFSVLIVFFLAYIYGKPRLFGDDPAEYWEMRSHRRQQE
jgi:nicotinamide riboside transporter PnuC